MTRFDTCIPRLLRTEGGRVNDPLDPGHATNKGVTLATLQSLGIDVNGDGKSDIVDLNNLTDDAAGKVYKHFYWDKCDCGFLPSGIDYCVFDYAVNSGVWRASSTLQVVLGVFPDGNIGPKTIAAAMKCDPSVVIQNMIGSRTNFLHNLIGKNGKPLWDHFGRGWQARLDSVKKDSMSDAVYNRGVN